MNWSHCAKQTYFVCSLRFHEKVVTYILCYCRCSNCFQFEGRRKVLKFKGGEVIWGIICLLPPPLPVEIGLNWSCKIWEREGPSGSDSPAVRRPRREKFEKVKQPSDIFCRDVYVCAVIYLSEIWKTRREIRPATYYACINFQVQILAEKICLIYNFFLDWERDR